MQSKKEKSRSQKPYEFFQTLQLEWIVADLRERIYPKDKDKAFWRKVKEGKRQKIESIAEKNQLPTIFDDKEMFRFYEGQIYKPEGVPQFIYKDDSHRNAQEPLDFTYYYQRGVDVRVEVNAEVKVGKVKLYIPYSETISIDVDGEVYILPTAKVTRIL